MGFNKYLQDPVVPYEQGLAVDPQVEGGLMAGADADPYTGGNKGEPLTALHTQHAGNGPHHDRAVRTADQGGVPGNGMTPC